MIGSVVPWTYGRKQKLSELLTSSGVAATDCWGDRLGWSPIVPKLHYYCHVLMTGQWLFIYENISLKSKSEERHKFDPNSDIIRNVKNIKDLGLLYKHQWNTKWAFPRKLHIFTREDNMLSSHVKRSPSLWLHWKYLSKIVWYFTGVYIINRILHARLWIWILSSRGQLDISRVSCAHSWDIELTTRR